MKGRVNPSRSAARPIVVGMSMWLAGGSLGQALPVLHNPQVPRPRRVCTLLPIGPVALSEARESRARKPLETIGDHVRERPLARGLSQARPALAIGVSRDALAR